MLNYLVLKPFIKIAQTKIFLWRCFIFLIPEIILIYEILKEFFLVAVTQMFSKNDIDQKNKIHSKLFLNGIAVLFSTVKVNFLGNNLNISKIIIAIHIFNSYRSMTRKLKCLKNCLVFPLDLLINILAAKCTNKIFGFYIWNGMNFFIGDEN